MNLYIFLADVVVVLHFAYVAFVVVGLAAIIAGALLHWSWVRNFWFRAIHALMIAVVVVESLCGVLCPLTEWEDRLREAGGMPNEPGSFVGRWASDLLFVSLSPSVLSICYVVFGVAVLLTFLLAPPRRPWRSDQ